MTERKSATVTLNGPELVRLEQIVMDKDKDEAMRFVQMVKDRVEQQQKSQMKPAV